MPAFVPAPGRVSARVAYQPGLDGLRALAVSAVVLYHGAPEILPGGFLGVEVFFVISGYLITALLVAEHSSTRRIDLRSFWGRRARRLLPALALLLMGIVLWCSLVRPERLPAVRFDALMAALYVSNWAQIAREQPYFEVFGPPPLLQHLWSLAIEEQFYLLWPPALLLLLRALSRRWILLLVVLAAAASAGWMAATSMHAGSERAYYGTDTRAAGLLIGAAVAIAWPAPLHSRDSRSRFRALAADALALAAVVATLVMFARMSEHDPWLYRGGFGLCAVLTAAAIAVAARPSSFVGRALAIAPMRWVGVRSYSIYLWHWPIYVLLPPGTAGLTHGALLGVQIALILILSELTFRVIEVPFRHGALGRLWSWLRLPSSPRHVWLAPGAVAAGMLAVTLLAWATFRPTPDEVPAYLRSSAQTASETGAISVAASLAPGRGATSRMDGSPAAPRDDLLAGSIDAPQLGADERPSVADDAAPQHPDSEPPPPTARESTALTTAVSGMDSILNPEGAASASPATASPAEPSASSTSAALPAPPEQTMPVAAAGQTPTPAGGAAAPVPPPSTQTVTAFGDSVMLGAAAQLQAATGAYVDAEVGRQFPAVVSEIESQRSAGTLGEVVILHIGTNGLISDEDVDQAMALLGDRTLVIWVTLRVPREYEKTSNDAIRAAVRYPNVVVVDWHEASEEHDEYFWNDHVHLRPEGADVYASEVADALQGSN